MQVGNTTAGQQHPTRHPTPARQPERSVVKRPVQNPERFRSALTQNGFAGPLRARIKGGISVHVRSRAAPAPPSLRWFTSHYSESPGSSPGFVQARPCGAKKSALRQPTCRAGPHQEKRGAAGATCALGGEGLAAHRVQDLGLSFTCEPVPVWLLTDSLHPTLFLSISLLPDLFGSVSLRTPRAFASPRARPP